MKKLLIICLLTTGICKAQDPIFTMGYSSPMYLNPALAGLQKGYLANMQYRNQWPKISGHPITATLGIQKRIDTINTGVGLTFLHDAIGETMFTTNIGLSASKHFSLSEKWKLSIGASFNYQQKALDWSKINFTNDPQLTLTTIDYFNLNSGIALTSPFLNVGFALNNITRPNQNFFPNSTSRLPIHFTMHASYNYHLRGAWILNPSIFAHYQQTSYLIASMLSIQYNGLKIIGGYSFKNALISGAGIEIKKFMINYIYETTVSSLGNSTTGGSHELAMSFRFGKNL
ncbi:MAG: PorP/SprF family type IX secretion system membrane protein [Bacteroidetes bacterium]|nr:PorP/SprF family type IX secretion system membrane protein [Bacteroidota bacterium]